MRRLMAAPVVSLVALALASAGPAAAQEPVVGQAEVRMLDQGAEPRQLLRYAFVEGSTDVVDIDIDMSMGMAVDGVEMMTFDLPMGMRTTTTVTDVYEDGSARVEFAISDWDLSGMTELLGEAAGMADMAMLEGLGGWMVVDPRGAVLEQGFDVPEGASIQMAPQPGQMTSQIAPLPEEPVGIGARWESVISSAVPGFDMEMSATSEIVSMDGDVVVLEQAFASDMAPDLSALMGMDMDMGDSFMDIAVSGGGTAELQLDRVSQLGDQQIVMSMDMGMDMGIEGAEGMTRLTYDIVMDVVSTAADR